MTTVVSDSILNTRLYCPTIKVIVVFRAPDPADSHTIEDMSASTCLKGKLCLQNPSFPEFLPLSTLQDP